MQSLFSFFAIWRNTPFGFICHPYIRNQEKERSMRNTNNTFRVSAAQNMNKGFAEINNNEENQDVLLSIKKAYRLAKGSMHGFKDWCKDKEISGYFYAEKEIAELEGGYLYSVFVKTFPDWLKSNNLKNWKDVETFVGGKNTWEKETENSPS